MFSIDQELYLFLKHVRPYLLEICSNENRILIWVAVLIQFSKDSDPGDLITRWSSFRNQTFFNSNLATAESRMDFVDGLIHNFLDDVIHDITSQMMQIDAMIRQTLNEAKIDSN
jgi:hypothetical protein